MSVWLSSSSHRSQHVTPAHDIIWPSSRQSFPDLQWCGSLKQACCVTQWKVALFQICCLWKLLCSLWNCAGMRFLLLFLGLYHRSHPNKMTQRLENTQAQWKEMCGLHVCLYVYCSRWEWMKDFWVECVITVLSTLASTDRHRYLADRSAVISPLSSPNHRYSLCVYARLCVYVPNEG